jgi:tetratricopeptide (TPR) repeat protein
MRRILGILQLFVVFGIQAQNEYDNALQQANNKHYQQAILSFEKIAESNPENESVYYNLGNCYYHIRRYGDAIWAYEKVLKQNPMDNEVIMNLELCYKKLGSNHSWQPHLSGMQQLIIAVGSNTWSYLALFLSMTFAFCLFNVLKKESAWHRPMLLLGVGTLILLITSIACAFASYDQLKKSYFGIVTKNETPVFLNDEGLKSTFKLAEGMKVAIIEQKASNYLVQLENGRTLLVNSKHIRLI